MIIACERCKTRFNVPDDKLGAGPVRMRCSKCDHTFVASAASAAPALPTVTATASLPPTSTQSLTPVGRAPTPAASPNPFQGLPPTHSTEAFGALNAPSATTPFAAAPFSAPRPPTPAASSTAIFGATPMPVTGVVGPFPGPSPAPGPFGAGPGAGAAKPDPFAALAAPPAPDPFAALAAPAGPPDPFAALAGAGAPRAPDPFAAMAPPAAAPPKSPAPDPFASVGPPAGAPKASSPDPFASLGPSAAATASDPFATAAAPADPFSPRPSFGDLFGPGPTPAAPPPPAAPASSAPFGAMPTSDPFAAAAAPPQAPPPAPPAPAPFGDVDPFADGAADAGGPTRDPFADDAPADLGDARAALFGISAPAPAASSGPPPMPSATSSGLELATPPPTTTTAAPHAVSSAPSRLVGVLAATAQVVLLIGFTLLAVVVGRGGSIGALLTGDVVGALAVGVAPENGLVIDDVVVARRQTSGGLAVLVISGVVHHTGTAPLPAVVVDADVGGVLAKGQAWTAVTPAAIEAARSAEDLAVLQAMRSASPTVSPGDRAPFVIVMAAPEGTARPRLSARQAD